MMGVANLSGAVARRRKILLGMFTGLVFLSFALPMAVVLVLFKTFFIPSGAMENTLLVGDHIIVRKVLCRPVHRGDVVVFKRPAAGGSYYLKRCVAVAGDRIAIRDNGVYLNDKLLDESYAKGRTLPAPAAGGIFGGVVPEGKIAVLGDNRENSMDSRHFGLVDEATVEGKAVLVYWNSAQVAKSGFSHLGLVR